MAGFAPTVLRRRGADLGVVVRRLCHSTAAAREECDALYGFRSRRADLGGTSGRSRISRQADLMSMRSLTDFIGCPLVGAVDGRHHRRHRPRGTSGGCSVRGGDLLMPTDRH